MTALSAEEIEAARLAFEHHAGGTDPTRILFKRGGSVFAEHVPGENYFDDGIQHRWLEWLACWLAAKADALAQQPPSQPQPSAEGPKELWLQLHGDCSESELSEPVDYTSDDITWCCEPLYAGDVRYVRGDLAEPQPVAQGGFTKEQRENIESAIRSLRYSSHPHRSPHADDLEAMLSAAPGAVPSAGATQVTANDEPEIVKMVWRLRSAVRDDAAHVRSRETFEAVQKAEADLIAAIKALLTAPTGAGAVASALASPAQVELLTDAEIADCECSNELQTGRAIQRALIAKNAPHFPHARVKE